MRCATILACFFGCREMLSQEREAVELRHSELINAMESGKDFRAELAKFIKSEALRRSRNRALPHRCLLGRSNLGYA
jgi:hypothetical protein